MSRVKNQHYVPRFYLKRFTEDGSSIYAFDKKDGKVFRANIAGIASQRYFYDVLDHPELNPQDIENALSELEGDFAKALSEFLEEVEQGHRFTFGHTTRNLHLAEFLLMQLMRTPDFRERREEMLNRGFKDVFDMVRKIQIAHGHVHPEDPVPPTPRFDSTPLNHAEFMFGDMMPRFAPMLLKHLWYVFKNTSDHPYFTSDVPVVLHQGKEARTFGGVGFMSWGVEIMFPLSSRYMLVLLDRSFWGPKIQVPEGSILPYEDRDKIIGLNRFQMVNCRRQAYCSQNQFDLYA